MGIANPPKPKGSILERIMSGPSLVRPGWGVNPAKKGLDTNLHPIGHGAKKKGWLAGRGRPGCLRGYGSRHDLPDGTHAQGKRENVRRFCLARRSYCE